MWRARFGGVLIAALALAAFADVLTQHNDDARTGANLQETNLTPDNVNKEQFGKLFDCQVDGQIYAQPLVVSSLRIGGAVHNVVFVATEHNSVYAFDADNGQQLWTRNYGRSAPTPNVYWPIPQGYAPYHDLVPEIGITSTPVIDRETNTLYFTNFTQHDVSGGPRWRHRLHAVDLTNGADKFGGPAEINGALPSSLTPPAVPGGTYHAGRHVIATAIYFDPPQQHQRAGLLLLKSGNSRKIVAAFGAHADARPFAGWVFAYDARDLTQKPGVWVSNTDNGPEGGGAGIWQAGMGLTADSEGSFYFMTGNGFLDEATAFGESVLRLRPSGNTIQQEDYFSPCNRQLLDQHDWDLGSSGLLLLAERGWVVGGGKQGRIYVLDKGNLGKASPAGDITCSDTQILQEFQAIWGDPAKHKHIHGSPVYWDGETRGPAIYVWGENDVLRAYPIVGEGSQWRFQAGDPSGQPAWTIGRESSPAHPVSPTASMMTGGMLSISANSRRGGIVWATTPTNNDANAQTVPGIIRAYDASDLSRELWDSYQNRDYDDFGNFAKFTPPTIANGKVYVATFSRQLSVYGLLDGKKRPALPANLVRNPGFEDCTPAPGGVEDCKTGWTGEGRPDVFTVAGNYPHYGQHYGALNPDGRSGAGLFQKIQAPKTGEYLLTAYCATNIPHDDRQLNPERPVRFGVDVAGKKVRELTVGWNEGYQRFTIRFRAAERQEIKIWYHAPVVKIDFSDPYNRKIIAPPVWAAIDDVSLLSP